MNVEDQQAERAAFEQGFAQASGQPAPAPAAPAAEAQATSQTEQVPAAQTTEQPGEAPGAASTTAEGQPPPLQTLAQPKVKTRWCSVATNAASWNAWWSRPAR